MATNELDKTTPRHLNEKPFVNFLFWVIFAVCLLPVVPSYVALILGIIVASCNLIPAKLKIGAITKTMLSYSIVGLGFGITIDQATAACQNGLSLIIGSIAVTLIVGIIIVILAILGYNSNINITKKGIEVQSQNSNSILNGYE